MSDLITEFDAETFALVQRPADCAPHGGCASYDWAHNSKHFHCEVPMDGKGPESVLRCNKLVFVEQDGPDAGDYYVEPEHGIRCAECKDVACPEHAEISAGRKLCSFCLDEESLTRVQALLAEIEIDRQLFDLDTPASKLPPLFTARRDLLAKQGIRDADRLIGIYAKSVLVDRSERLAHDGKYCRVVSCTVPHELETVVFEKAPAA